jgi:hypothetical protein
MENIKKAIIGQFLVKKMRISNGDLHNYSRIMMALLSFTRMRLIFAIIYHFL